MAGTMMMDVRIALKQFRKFSGVPAWPRQDLSPRKTGTLSRGSKIGVSGDWSYGLAENSQKPNRDLTPEERPNFWPGFIRYL